MKEMTAEPWWKKLHPTCAKCGRPVERFEGVHSAFEDVIVLVAMCHGATERLELTGELKAAAGPSLRGGVAFRNVSMELPAAEMGKSNGLG